MNRYIFSLFSSLILISSCTQAPVSPAGMISIRVNPETLSLQVGETSVVDATITTTASTTPEIEWSSSKPEVASVDKGVVTGKSTGTATIFAKAEGIAAQCEVTVSAKMALIKTISSSTYNHTFCYDDKNRIREVTIISPDRQEGGKLISETEKGFIEYLSGGKSVMVCERIISSNNVKQGGERFEYELSLDSNGRITRAKNVLIDKYSIDVTIDQDGLLKGKQYGYYNYSKQNDDKISLEYSYNPDESLKQIQMSESGSTSYTYGTQEASEPVNILDFSIKSEWPLQDILINMNVGLPKSKKLLTSWNSGAENLTYQFDGQGRVTKVITNQTSEETYTYVERGTQTYTRKDPYVYSGMGGTTWVYTETESRTQNWYIVFLDATNFVFIEDDGDGFQDMIYGTYTQKGSTITMTITSSSDLITTGIISGNSMTTKDGYFGGSTYTKTDNLLL